MEMYTFFLIILSVTLISFINYWRKTNIKLFQLNQQLSITKKRLDRREMEYENLSLFMDELKSKNNYLYSHIKHNSKTKMKHIENGLGYNQLFKINTLSVRDVQKLNEIGIYNLSQIAKWTEVDISFMAKLLNIHPIRIKSEYWVGQAKENLQITKSLSIATSKSKKIVSLSRQL